MLLHAAWFRDAYDPRPVAPGLYPWDVIARRLTTPRPHERRAWLCPAGCPRRAWSPGACACGAPLALDKRTCPAWSPWSFRAGAKRSERAAVEGSALVVDYDGGIHLDAARSMWCEWEHVAHTSWSHVDDADAHVRIVVPLAAPQPAEGYGRLYRWSCDHDPRQDRTLPDPGRLWFLPVLRSGAPPLRTWHHRGPVLALDWRDLPAAPGEAARELVPGARPKRDALGRFEDSELYRGSPEARAELARRSGGTVAGNIGRGVPCPACGRASVWWRIDPGELSPGAFCDHKRSCGWVGFLDHFDRAARGAS